MKLHPRVTRSVVELVKRFEGLRRRAARLADGGWTIGYGHTRSAREGAVVSPEDADALLYYDLSEVAEKVEAWTFTPLNQNQFEALTAFAFNIGVENFRRSTVLKRVNEGQHLMAAAALELWRKADFGGEDLVVDALVRRRAAEKAHYLTPPEGFRPSPTPVLKPTFDHSVIEAAANARAGRAAAVVDAPLEGDEAIATVGARVEPTDPNQIASPFVAGAATGVATARLHQLFPDKVARTEDAVGEPPFALEPERSGFDLSTSQAVNDAPFNRLPEPESETEGPSLDVPAPPTFEPTPFTARFAGFAPPPVRQFDTPPSLPSAETKPADKAAPPPPAIEETQMSAPMVEPEPLFDTPSPRPAVSIPEGVRTMRLRDDTPPAAEAVDDPHHHHFNDEEIVNGYEPGPLHNRSLIYFSIGLLGVALFAAALFSMFSGSAKPANLVIGLMGILLMTPAGGYFLMQFLNKRDGLVDA